MKLYRILGKKGRITIPYEIRKEICFAPGDVVSFESDGATVTVRREQLFVEANASSRKDNADDVILELIDKMSEEQQREMLITLSVKWAEKQETSK